MWFLTNFASWYKSAKAVVCAESTCELHKHVQRTFVFQPTCHTQYASHAQWLTVRYPIAIHCLCRFVALRSARKDVGCSHANDVDSEVHRDHTGWREQRTLVDRRCAHCQWCLVCSVDDVVLWVLQVLVRQIQASASSYEVSAGIAEEAHDVDA